MSPSSVGSGTHPILSFLGQPESIFQAAVLYGHDYAQQTHSETYAQTTLHNVVIDSTAKHLSCDGLLRHKFITQFDGETIF